MRMVNFGVIGVKGIGRGHVDCIRKIEGARLLAIAEIDEEAGRKAAADYNVDLHVDYREMLERRDVDAVCICTPHFLHAPMAIEAMEQGKHVLVEKPMAVTVGEADQMVHASRRFGVKLGVVFQYRTSPMNIEVKNMIDKGVLGRIYRALMEACGLRTQAYYKSAAWRGTWGGEGGGVLINQAIHDFDILQWFLGKPRELYGRIGCKVHEIEVEDIASATILFRNGAHAVVQVSNIESPSISRLEIYGDKGKIVKEDGVRLAKPETSIKRFIRENPAMWGQPKSEWIDLKPAPSESGHVAVIRDFAKAIAEDREPMVTGEEGITSLEIVNAIILSHFKKKVVKFPVDRAEYASLMEKLRLKKKWIKKLN